MDNVQFVLFSQIRKSYILLRIYDPGKFVCSSNYVIQFCHGSSKLEFAIWYFARNHGHDFLLRY